MAVTVISGFNRAGRAEYGNNFLETFDRHWPKDVKLICYVEEDAFPAGRAELRSLLECRGAKEFQDRHADNSEYSGRKPNGLWKEKSIGKPYNFRFDARKFAKQMMIPEAAAQSLPDGEIMVWLDGDVTTFADVPGGFVESLIGTADVAYLGRKSTHSEIGFWAVRLNEKTRAFVDSLAEMYRSDAVFDLPEYHSAFVFDHCRRHAERRGLVSKNLTPNGFGHVFTMSQCAAYLDHRKGRRKALARSPERK